MPEPTPEAWAQIRYEYENTDRPLAHICAEHGISIPTMRYRMKRWEWRRRKPLVPREGPPPVAVAPYGDTFLHPPLEGEGRRLERQRKPAGWGEAEEFAEHPTPEHVAPFHPTPPFFRTDGRERPFAGEGEKEEAPADATSIVPRLQSAVARVLPAIEATIARLAAGPYHARDMEQAGRTLSSLTRTLRELNTLLSQHNARAEAASDYYDLPQDLDAVRDELARRINLFMESRKDEDWEAKPAET
jgi:hypothetical protein